MKIKYAGWLAVALLCLAAVSPLRAAEPAKAAKIVKAKTKPLQATAGVPVTLDWPNYGNDLGNNRFQNVDQINTKNIKNLKVAWVFHTGVIDQFSPLELSPLVVNGVMYITDGHDDVFAVNAATGAQIWAVKPTDLPDFTTLPLAAGRINRGVAVGNGKVFYGRLDNVVVAFNQATGAEAWRTTVANPQQGYSITGAATFVVTAQHPNGLVLISVAGNEYLIRGQSFALDAATGAVVWQRFLTDGPDSWGGSSFLHGGAGLWGAATVDPALGLAYLNTGNAAPDLLGQDRPGNNNYTAGILAVNLDTGAIQWFFQEVHHDLWDYDACQNAMLFNLTRNGVSVPAIGHCNKGGQYFILNRATGVPIYAVTETPVPTGPNYQHASPTQPISAVEPLTPLTLVRPNDTGVPSAPIWTVPSQTEVLIQPGVQGGCEWVAPAFSPRTNFVYYGASYEPSTYKTKPNNTDTFLFGVGSNVPATVGSTFFREASGTNAFGIFGATDVTTGKIVWKKEVTQPARSGMLVAGDIVFFGELNGIFHGVNAQSGAELFTFNGPQQVQNAGGSASAPIAYVVNGQEFIADAFGGNALDHVNFPPVPVGDAIVAFTLPK